MKYSPVMKKVDLTAQADRLREDALALVEEEEWDFQNHRLPHPFRRPQPGRQPVGADFPGRLLQEPGPGPPLGGRQQKL